MHSQVSERRFDLSRDTFDATRLYRSIVRQQGRVTVDADEQITSNAVSNCIAAT